jgi:starch phosphorylase
MSHIFNLPTSQACQIAYFSMEVGLDPRIPTYSGGLGALAGDAIRSAADLRVPMIAVTLLYRKGFFRQSLDENAWQHEEPEDWRVEDLLKELPPRVTVSIEGRTVYLRAWRYDVRGSSGATVPVLLLDADLPENAGPDRTLTDFLYGGDSRYRLCQEVILGIGGVRILRALGHRDLQRFHMNEGHAALLGLELLDERARASHRDSFNGEDVAAIRPQCVFTTHTPVPAGHDEFPLDLVASVLGRHEVVEMKEVFCWEDRLNMTLLALNLSHYVNGVAKKHAEVSRRMFAKYKIDAITNGVHAETWTSGPFIELFNRHIPGWKTDNSSLRQALKIPSGEIWEAHQQAKRRLLERVNRETDVGMEDTVLTLGFARRATGYKRGDLLVADLDRLKRIAASAGRLQIIYAGKAHPRDQTGKDFIHHIGQVKDMLGRDVRIVYLQNYDMELAGLITSGVDVWLNTPQPPLEASGTSGMKAALNGVPSLSVLDGWWIEGCIEGKTGWAVGTLDPANDGHEDRSARDAASLYDQLENVVIPLFYGRCDQFIEVMRHCIALNGSFFNTHRMLQQYVLKAYFA